MVSQATPGNLGFCPLGPFLRSTALQDLRSSSRGLSLVTSPLQDERSTAAIHGPRAHPSCTPQWPAGRPECLQPSPTFRKLLQVFKDSHTHFVQILQEAIEDRHQASCCQLIPENHCQFMNGESKDTADLPLGVTADTPATISKFNSMFLAFLQRPISKPAPSYKKVRPTSCTVASRACYSMLPSVPLCELLLVAFRQCQF